MKRSLTKSYHISWEECLGHPTEGRYVCILLHRTGWCRVAPRIPSVPPWCPAQDAHSTVMNHGCNKWSRLDRYEDNVGRTRAIPVQLARWLKDCPGSVAGHESVPTRARVSERECVRESDGECLSRQQLETAGLRTLADRFRRSRVGTTRVHVRESKQPSGPDGRASNFVLGMQYQVGFDTSQKKRMIVLIVVKEVPTPQTRRLERHGNS